MSERKCIATVNRYGYPMAQPCRSSDTYDYHAPLRLDMACADSDATKRACQHHEPLYETEPLDYEAQSSPAFWLVWCRELHHIGNEEHPTETEARAAAERLARVFPFQTFYVLPASEFVTVNEVPVTWGRK